MAGTWALADIEQDRTIASLLLQKTVGGYVMLYPKMLSKTNTR